MAAQQRQRIGALENNKALQAALKHRGLTTEKLIELEATKPHAFAQVYQTSVNRYLDVVQSKKSAHANPLTSMKAIRHQANPDKIAELAKKRTGRDADIDKILDALISPGDPIFDI